MMNGFLTPERRSVMVQALAGAGGAGGGGDQWAGLRQGIADFRARQRPQSEMVFPGTMANGGWQTSLEGMGGQGGLLGLLSGLFNRGQQAPTPAQTSPYTRDMNNIRARQMAQALGGY